MLTIIYTANLRGNLNLLPRLYTLMRQMSYGGRVLRLDAGAACADTIWHCQVTGGRSTLLVLDAMGYDAANVTGYLTPAGREKIAANLLNMRLLDEGVSWSEDRIAIMTGSTPDGLHDLHVVLAAHPTTTLDGKTLYLASVDAGQVGIAQVDRAEGNGRLTLRQHEILTMSASALPDPTIAATVEFVLSEARYIQQRRPQDD
jgi:hypothetical protein